MTEPKTWEEAAHAAAAVIDHWAKLGASGRGGLSASMLKVRDEGEELDSSQWGVVAGDAMRSYLGKSGTYWTFAEGLDDVVETVISKQHDYGHGNILAYGIQGVCVRLSDKWARIQNLEQKGVDAQNESLLDSYLDLVGYCIIAIMLCEGTFELPLEADLPKPVVTSAARSMLEAPSIAIALYVKNEIDAALAAHLAAFHPRQLPNDFKWVITEMTHGPQGEGPPLEWNQHRGGIGEQGVLF